MKVQNMTSTNGNKIANQFIIEDEGKICFQSYDSMIVTIDYNTQTIVVGNDWDYSQTTGKYRNLFMKNYTRFGLDMGDKKGFEYYLNLGAIANYTIIKEAV